MDIQEMMKQAQEMQLRMQELQAELAETPVEACAEGLVTVTMTAGGILLAIAVDDSLCDRDKRSTLERLILQAHSEAKDMADSLIAQETALMMEGLNFPAGMGLPQTTLAEQDKDD